MRGLQNVCISYENIAKTSILGGPESAKLWNPCQAWLCAYVTEKATQGMWILRLHRRATFTRNRTRSHREWDYSDPFAEHRSPEMERHCGWHSVRKRLMKLLSGVSFSRDTTFRGMRLKQHLSETSFTGNITSLRRRPMRILWETYLNRNIPSHNSREIYTHVDMHTRVWSTAAGLACAPTRLSWTLNFETSSNIVLAWPRWMDEWMSG